MNNFLARGNLTASPKGTYQGYGACREKFAWDASGHTARPETL